MLVGKEVVGETSGIWDGDGKGRGCGFSESLEFFLERTSGVGDVGGRIVYSGWIWRWCAKIGI